MSIEISTKGIGIEIKSIADKFFVEIDMYGKLTHQDYEVMMPVIEHAIKASVNKELDILVDMRDFEGWEFEAMIDDMRFGLEIKDSFDKMVIVGDKSWEEWSVKAMSHLVKGEVKYFEDYDEAMKWLISQ